MKARKSCWTCKDRKIGCDKTLPACNNCIRTKRNCAGFGIKLTWPEKYDGRRKAVIPSIYGQGCAATTVFCPSLALDFLNTTTEDIEISDSCDLTGFPAYAQLLRLNTWTLPTLPLPGITNDDASLLSYYEGRLARIITTVDDAHNGFRNEILPMALTQQSKASQSLMESILALCAFHVSGPSRALQHKARALRLLNQSLQEDVSEDLSAKLAACMLLCVYGVFDPTDGNWMVHLRGAKSLIGDHPSHPKTQQSVSPFLRSWLLYHDVLAQFSQMMSGYERQDPTQVVLPEYTAEKTVIVGSLGCSEELMELVACINQLRGQPQFDASLVETLRLRLENLTQDIVIKPEQQSHSRSETINETRIHDTAEFYHLAALIYFRRQIVQQPSQSRSVQRLVERALSLIAKMEVCTSPWPLFVVACEVRIDEQRLQILQTLKKMELHRRIGNIGVTRMIVEAFWKQQDLVVHDTAKTVMDWRNIVDMAQMTPSFI
ncbi:fungal-specific transcription factor domain-containing protein [Exophiala viscosa]|uniref:Fungal-specific transcription factor domain-containing protein n=1 Tax=Exophiala viscosa TaxID=2486360 RepID=A0AAN6DZ29_9EURO|nr:fungal-specific transcription factor domain-containing protein [Exophiala viscosa]